MRKIGVIFFLSSWIFASAASAEWLFSSEDGFSKTYMDRDSATFLSDGAVSINALTDYDPALVEARGFGLSRGLSKIEKVLLDCKNKKYKSEGGRWFKGHMGSENMTKQYDAKPDWMEIPPFYVRIFSSMCSAQ